MNGRLAGLARLVGLSAAAAASVVASAEAGPAVPSWTDAIARAAAEEKAIVALLRPPVCDAAEGRGTCEKLARLVEHPAIRRRLGEVVFATRAEGDRPAIAAYDPSGQELTRWTGITSGAQLSGILTLVIGASPDLVAAHRASLAGRQDLRRRHLALAFLTLGMEARGRELIESMISGAGAEDRELGTLWLDALDAVRKPRPREMALLNQLALSGSTALVRFEALMALGATHVSNGQLEEALRSYSEAGELAPGPRLVANARRARQRVIDRASPFVGVREHEGVVVGRRTVRPRDVPRTATTGEFRLDGRRVGRTVKPPFIATVDFGRAPVRHVLEFLSFDGGHRELQRVSTVVNERRDAFTVRITAPTESLVSGRVRVAASATVPRGRQIESVTVEWRGSIARTFSTPPFETEIGVARGEEGFLRVVLRLDDGAETEDVRLINAVSLTLSSTVHLVEVPVTIEGGVPAPATVVLRESGRRSAVERVLTAADAPLHIALLLDTSSSMSDHLLDLQESAARYVERNIGPKDRATLIAFAGSGAVLWPTNDRPTIVRTILGLQPGGGTALYSAIVSALFNLQSPGRRRAVVVFTDGIDTGSSFSIEDVEEVARRMAIPLYVLLFDARAEPSIPYGGSRGMPSTGAPFRRYHEGRALSRISRDSGGKVFALRSLEGIDAIWSEIAEELRRQALIVFRPSEGTESWRSLEITAPGYVVRGPKGIHVSTAVPPPQ